MINYLKCRFIIELLNGRLKSFRALENVKNTVVGHISIDYRIACAMLNLTFRPFNTDGLNAVKIAKRIRRMANIEQNYLSFILDRQLDTTCIVRSELASVTDFVKLSEQDLKNKILFGSFQFNCAIRYLSDFLESATVYNIEAKFINTVENTCLKNELASKDSKIIATEITSRHRRSLKKSKNDSQSKKSVKKKIKYNTIYKVFVHYVPNTNGAAGIKGFFNFVYILQTVSDSVHFT